MKLFIWIYSLPLWTVGFIISGSIFLWFSMAVKYYTLNKNSIWRTINLLFFIIEIVIVLALTILFREHTDTELRMIPFETFIKAKGQSEFYRTMLMNILLFFPYGLFLPFVFTNKMKYRVTITILSSLVLSVLIEFVQYKYKLGYCEIDDVIMNVAGVIIGTLAYMLLQLYYKHIKKI